MFEYPKEDGHRLRHRWWKTSLWSEDNERYPKQLDQTVRTHQPLEEKKPGTELVANVKYYTWEFETPINDTTIYGFINDRIIYWGFIPARKRFSKLITVLKLDQTVRSLQLLEGNNWFCILFSMQNASSSKHKTTVTDTIIYGLISDCIIYWFPNFQLKKLFWIWLQCWNSIMLKQLFEFRKKKTMVRSLMPVETFSSGKFRTPSNWCNYLWIHKLLYRSLGFRIFFLHKFFQIWLQFFEDMNEFPATHNRLCSITIALLFSLSIFHILFVCFSLPFQTFHTDHFPSQSTVLDVSTAPNNIHPISSARSSSFNKNLWLLFIDAFGTTGFWQKFRACHLSWPLFRCYYG